MLEEKKWGDKSIRMQVVQVLSFFPNILQYIHSYILVFLHTSCYIKPVYFKVGILKYPALSVFSKFISLFLY